MAKSNLINIKYNYYGLRLSLKFNFCYIERLWLIYGLHVAFLNWLIFFLDSTIDCLTNKKNSNEMLEHFLSFFPRQIREYLLRHNNKFPLKPERIV